MKLFRIAAGLSQQELARRIHSHTMRISRIERGAIPDPDEEVAIATELNVEPSDIFPKRKEAEK
jgi:transcriptional regulator with XRE-family HTH domain